jgi:hypothetical protein
MLDLEQGSSVYMVLHLVSYYETKGRKTLDLPDDCFTKNKKAGKKGLSMKTKFNGTEANEQANQVKRTKAFKN